MNIPTETKSKDFSLSSIKSINGKFICSSSRQFESWTQFTAEVRLLIFLVSTCSSLTSRTQAGEAAVDQEDKMVVPPRKEHGVEKK
ncbi:hypothetical protein DY000_02008621 [Brassica cretica]|uniref:Uncharacterized protein n=1 Tax=Brassica cretica TaxID=69181 RepID=A0ABQ7BWC7_BRACR|nr:hypothetical protein DY000_02008621 [Brassica cretica]